LTISRPSITVFLGIVRQVKGVRSSMSSAKLYLESNVVDRLSRVIVPTNKGGSEADQSFENDRPVMDMAAFMNSINGGTVAPSFSTPSNRRASTANTNTGGRFGGGARPQSGGGAGAMTAEEKQRRQSQFSEFIGRQEQSLIRKERNKVQVEKNVTPHFTPKICRHSSQIVRQNSQADFLERMEQATIKKNDNEIKRQSLLDSATCTFQPKITKKSEKLRPRSSFEMSKGDMMKIESKKTSIAQRREMEEEKLMPFKPTISQRAKSKKSLLADPSALLENYHERLAKKEQARTEQLREREQKELDQCTFAPATRDCPSYIAKIAASMDAINRARGPTSYVQDASKPTWR
jgi:hypothetical protein